MAKDRYANTKNRERAAESRRADYSAGAQVTKEAWRTENRDQILRIERLMADPLCDSHPAGALSRWMDFLRKSELHTLSRGEAAALARIERAVHLRRQGVPVPPMSERRPRPHSVVGVGIKLSPRPDWMSDASKLPKAPPGRSK